jgi:hypothetical protein
LGACVALGAAHSAYHAGTSAPDQRTDDCTAISPQGVTIAFPRLPAGIGADDVRAGGNYAITWYRAWRGVAAAR